MSEKVYDVFADEYIDVKDMDPIAPPERYIEITEELLIRNSARWFINALGAPTVIPADKAEEAGA